jgi:hypothetical protein
VPEYDCVFAKTEAVLRMICLYTGRPHAPGNVTDALFGNKVALDAILELGAA